MEIEKVLEGLRLSIGSGEADFPMKRGSFIYKEKILWKKELVQGHQKSQDGDTVIPFLNKDESEAGRMTVSQDADGVTKLHFEFAEKVNRMWIDLPATEDEKIYGCGETFSKFNLRGEMVRIWVAEHQNSGRISKKIIKEKLFGKKPEKVLPFEKYESYYAQPTFVSSERYFVHVDSDAYMEFDFKNPKYHTLMIRDIADLWIGSADSFTELSRKLTEKLGRQEGLPDWIYDGVILGMQGGTRIVEEKLEKAEQAGTKVCGIWCQDWEGCRVTKFGYQLMWNWKWDEELYPNLDIKIREWKEKGIHFLGYINPFLAIEKELYQYATDHGYCVKNKEGKDYMVTITTFPAAMVDFTNPEAYEWIKGIIKENMIGLGLDGWMADFAEYLPPDCVLYSGEDPELVHNHWPAIWARINREAIEESGKAGQVFFFTRAGHTETIKYSTMMWNGDQHVDWSMDDGLPSVIPATLSLAMSGYGITHSDAGGYTTIMHMRRSEELLARWFEMNAFSPLLRTHEGNQPVNNVQYDTTEKILAHVAVMSQIHAGLKEYLKACVMEEQEKGTPVMRPLFYHYKEEKAFEEAYEYLLGRDILVTPVLREGEEKREVYLPEDEWVHLLTGENYSGGISVVDAPVGLPPVFIRKSSTWCTELRKMCEKILKDNRESNIHG